MTHGGPEPATGHAGLAVWWRLTTQGVLVVAGLVLWLAGRRGSFSSPRASWWRCRWPASHSLGRDEAGRPGPTRRRCDAGSIRPCGVGRTAGPVRRCARSSRGHAGPAHRRRPGPRVGWRRGGSWQVLVGRSGCGCCPGWPTGSTARWHAAVSAGTAARPARPVGSSTHRRLHRLRRVRPRVGIGADGSLLPFLAVLLAYYINGTAFLAFSSIAERTGRGLDDGRIAQPRHAHPGHQGISRRPLPPAVSSSTEASARS